MDEAKRRRRPPLGLRAALGLLAVVVAVAAFWVTSALAADGSAANDRSSGADPEAAYVQNGDGAAPDGDCPDRDGDSEQSSDI